jgi:amino acid transporter
MPSDDTPTPPTPPPTPSGSTDGHSAPKRRTVFKPQRRTSPGANPEREAGAPPQPAEPFRPEPAFRKPESRLQGDFSGKQQMRGSHLGDRYVRVVRQKTEDFERAGPGHLVATEEASEGRGPVGRSWKRVKRRLIGAPMTTAAAEHQRLSNPKALAVLSSDALSSVAYATEEIMRVLFIAGGLAALSHSLPIGAAIVALLIIVGISYRQTIKAYPHGGGAYIVAKDNLGELPSLTAGAALLTDYVLTVAVSIASAVAAMSSAFPELNDHRVIIGIFLILFVTTVNLRGLSESGTIFAIPTYMFLVGIFIMLGIGFARNAANGFPVHEPVMVSNEGAGVGAIGALVLLRAFASGCAALTGVEAISDGVPAFRKPESVNARKTLGVMITILAITFSGITFLAHQYGTLPLDQAEPNYQTVVSQIARQVFGGTNAAYYYIQFATMAILVLAANTSYSDFPRLAYFLARDSYIPKQYTYRGDRLAYTTGIVTLGLMASLVLAIFGGETERLIPLYALGVFLSFTISQASMCVRWVRKKEPGWHFGLAVNLAGAITTGIVAIIVVTTKFSHGAWIICIVIPLLILLLRGIHKHYQRSAAELAVSTPLDPNDIHHTVIVPVSQLNRVARQTLAYARSISDNVTAVHISDGEEEIQKFREDWARLEIPIPLVIIESPYRALVGPLLKYIDEIGKQKPNDTLTIVLPEFIARHWWEHLLHNQTALRLKAALLFRPGTVVTSVPYHLESDVEPVEA